MNEKLKEFMEYITNHSFEEAKEHFKDKGCYLHNGPFGAELEIIDGNIEHRYQIVKGRGACTAYQAGVSIYNDSELQQSQGIENWRESSQT